MSGTEGPLRIAVAGGSIGGLCTRACLRGAGFDVQVYERVSGAMETRGAGIVVQGELIDLLRTHGAGALPTTHCTVRRYLRPEGGEGQVQREAAGRKAAAVSAPAMILAAPRRFGRHSRSKRAGEANSPV
jgi:2-polyprenyl-6-methoxyphenol hydroxylase-like FAD-dependent oxidoreductase